MVVIYLERIPAPPLAGAVRMLWYAQSRDATHRRERVLPNGCVQAILNLARDFLLDCPEGDEVRPAPPALLMGARSIYEIVDTSDMEELAGVIFEPGAFPRFAGDSADRFSNRSVPLEELWGAPARSLRERLREIPSPLGRLLYLEEFLCRRLAPRVGRADSKGAIEFALRRFAQAPGVTTVSQVAKSTGWSERRFSQVFREEVGFQPKLWCRIQRFQRAVRLLHAGAEMHWSELALDCGFYDQSHFANEFRAFSGIDATTYSASRTRWANHVPVE